MSTKAPSSDLPEIDDDYLFNAFSKLAVSPSAPTPSADEEDVPEKPAHPHSQIEGYISQLQRVGTREHSQNMANYIPTAPADISKSKGKEKERKTVKVSRPFPGERPDHSSALGLYSVDTTSAPKKPLKQAPKAKGIFLVRPKLKSLAKLVPRLPPSTDVSMAGATSDSATYVAFDFLKPPSKRFEADYSKILYACPKHRDGWCGHMAPKNFWCKVDAEILYTYQ